MSNIMKTACSVSNMPYIPEPYTVCSLYRSIYIGSTMLPLQRNALKKSIRFASFSIGCHCENRNDIDYELQMKRRTVTETLWAILDNGNNGSITESTK